MRKGLLILPLLLSAVSFSGCKPIFSEKIVEDINENSNFEIALLTPADEADFSNFNTVPGMGITGYYNKKYDEYLVEGIHERYVQYDVSTYPTIVVGKQYVTGIEIKDPDVHIYGYTVGDSSQAFSDFLEDKGFDEFYNNGHMMKLSKGRVEIRFGFNNETQEIHSLHVGMMTTAAGIIY
jgi:hypothetical protein